MISVSTMKSNVSAVLDLYYFRQTNDKVTLFKVIETVCLYIIQDTMVTIWMRIFSFFQYILLQVHRNTWPYCQYEHNTFIWCLYRIIWWAYEIFQYAPRSNFEFVYTITKLFYSNQTFIFKAINRIAWAVMLLCGGVERPSNHSAFARPNQCALIRYEHVVYTECVLSLFVIIIIVIHSAHPFISNELILLCLHFLCSSIILGTFVLGFTKTSLQMAYA